MLAIGAPPLVPLARNGSDEQRSLGHVPCATKHFPTLDSIGRRARYTESRACRKDV
jgi:hypothetical protein